ncbi:hypothetical protein [Acetanaerobacterium elongatum]|uniref:PQ loop repeat-containing protein n=1 Tax=Acetanaerobacterium elongatum TaxID=258515 RepID=A0A1G9XAU6_9FIRM|nr:hypothetical protein [Acetanaerobacterium elongatum]SDM93912.1 hypothetical protein SAMN05192585_10818 [Acetanaerobacterium elongatum]
MSIFEAGMLICFGLAWPVNIYKSVTSRSTKGKSVFFLYVVIVGYIFGIIHKLLYSPDLVLGLYLLNIAMVTTDILLYYRNRHYEKKAEQAAKG